MHTHIYTHTVKSEPPAPAQPAFGKIKNPHSAWSGSRISIKMAKKFLQLKKKKKKKIDEKVRRT
jgi:hypothetical protein